MDAINNPSERSLPLQVLDRVLVVADAYWGHSLPFAVSLCPKGPKSRSCLCMDSPVPPFCRKDTAGVSNIWASELISDLKWPSLVSSDRVRPPREETDQRPDGEVQDAGAPGGQRVWCCDPQVRSDAPANHGRGESDLESKDPPPPP